MEEVVKLVNDAQTQLKNYLDCRDAAAEAAEKEEEARQKYSAAKEAAEAALDRAKRSL